MQLNNNKLYHLSISVLLALTLVVSSSALATEESESDYMDTSGIDSEAKGNRGLLDRFFKREAQSKDDERHGEDIDVRVQEQEKAGIRDNVAVLRVIDKTLGKLYLLDLEIGSKRTINEITIKATSCIRPSEKLIVPEGRAHIEVFETRKRAVDKLFSGWIYAQSPAVSQLSHPKYDITLAGCKAGHVAASPNASADKVVTMKQVSDTNASQ